MKNLICANSNTYHGFSFDETIKGIADAGFKYVELAAVKGYTEHVWVEMSDEEIEKVKSELERHGVQCIALGAHSNLMDEEGFNNFSKSIELAGKLGCQFIVTSTGDAHGDHDVIEDETILLNALEPLVAKCEQFGITLVIETHGNNYNTGLAVKKLAEKVNSSAFGVNYDTANVIFYGNVLPYEDLEESADQVKFIHLKDKLGENQEWNFPAVGKGCLDFEKVFRILESKNCDAPLSVEIEFTAVGPSDLDEVNLAMKDSFESIQKYLTAVNNK